MTIALSILALVSSVMALIISLIAVSRKDDL